MKPFNRTITLCFCLMLLLSGNSAITDTILDDNAGNYRTSNFLGMLAITGYTGKETKLAFPAELDGKKVVQIGSGKDDRAFYYNGFIEITIPEGVEAIADYTFADCKTLRVIEIPGSVRQIAPPVTLFAGLGDDYKYITIKTPQYSYADSYGQQYNIFVQHSGIMETPTPAPAPLMLQKVANLRKISSNASEIKLAWDEVPSAEQYEVAYQRAGTGWITCQIVLGSTSVTVMDLKEGMYSFKVTATSGSVHSESGILEGVGISRYPGSPTPTLTPTPTPSPTPDPGVKISSESFPDEYFRKYVSDHFDSNHDGLLSKSELRSVTRIEVPASCHDLTGIEYFTSLENLDRRLNQLSQPGMANTYSPIKEETTSMTATGQGFAGVVTVNVTFTEGGKISALSISKEGFAETPGFGARALDADELKDFIGAQAPLAVDTVDALTGATYTKTAIVEAINKAYGTTSIADTPSAEETIVPRTVTAKGLTGSFPVTVAFNKGNTVKAVTVGESDSTMDAAFLAMASTDEFLGQFTGKAIPVEGVDVTGGATISKTAILNAVNELGANNTPAAAVKRSATAKGFAGDITVNVTFTEDGKIGALSISKEGFIESPGFGARALDADELKGFIGAQVPLDVDTVDALAGATFTKTAIVEAINAAYLE